MIFIAAGESRRKDAYLLYCDWHILIRAGAPDLSSEIFLTVWIQPLLLTLQLMLVSVAIAGVIGIVGAWGASSIESQGRLGRFASRLFVASMVLVLAMPMILHAAAWEATAGKFGWLIMTQTGARADSGSAYGFFAGLVACGWIHGVVGSALVALACWYGTSRVPGEVVDQARLELSPLAQWWRVRLPAASPWWISGLVATAILAATEMTVVDLYGYRTIADEFYLIYAADPSLASVLITCALPLGMISALLIWWTVSRRRRLAVATPRDPMRRPSDQVQGIWSAVAWLSLVSVLILIVAVPLSGLVAKVGHEVVVTDGDVIARWSFPAFFERVFGAPRLFAQEYQWTAILSSTTAIVAVLIAWPLASLGRTHPNAETTFDVLTIVLVVIPGPIVAMLVVYFFQLDLPGFAALYEQTTLPTSVALLARSVPVAYWLLRAGYRGIDSAVLDSAALESSAWARMWSIDRPLLSRTFWTAFLATAIVASGDVPATLPIIPPGVSTVGTRLFGLLHSGARYQEASLAIWYMAAVVLLSLLLFQQGSSRRVKVD